MNVRTRLVDWATGAILWGAVLMAASGAGLLGARILETLQHGR